MLWWTVMLEATAGPAWVVRPLAPGAGVRVGDDAQVDLLVQPILGWTRQRSSVVAEGSSLVPDDDAITRTTQLGGQLDVVGRLALSDAPSRVLWALGGRAAHLRTSSPDPDVSPQWSATGALWTGPSLSVSVGGGWSLGADLELASASIGEARSRGFLQGSGLEFTSEQQLIDVRFFGGGHVWIAFRRP